VGNVFGDMRAAVGTIWKMPKKLGKQVLDTKLSQEWYALPRRIGMILKPLLPKAFLMSSQFL